MDFSTLCMGCMNVKGTSATCPNCGWSETNDALSPQHLKPGTILQGKYLIGRALGQGGFGITYLGFDINLNLKLAIKEYMPQDLASRSAGATQVSVYTSAGYDEQFEYGLNKFLQEARTLAQFEGHPSIVSVRDFFRENETAYIAMSYVEGATLKDYMKESGNKLDVEQAIAIIMPVLDALAEVHAVGILHRDISPDNIFINQKGQVILIDFGAARQAVSEKGRSLSIILKPGFTPEEQYRSQGKQGPWTDIYAVGVTLYSMICGQMPPESLDRLAEDSMSPPSQLGIAISKPVEATLLKAMAVKATDRFQTVREFQNALLGIAKPGLQAVPPPPPSAWSNPPVVPPPPPPFAKVSPPPPPLPGEPRSQSHSASEKPDPGPLEKEPANKASMIKRIALYLAAGLGVLFVILVIVAILTDGDETAADHGAAGEVIYNVPGDFPSVQEAIEKASSGAIIIVEPGTYYETIDFRGKELTLTSSDPDNTDIVRATVIDGGNTTGSVVSFVSGEGEGTKIIGLTITGGTGLREQIETEIDGELTSVGECAGGGILIMNGASPVIEKNVIRNNECFDLLNHDGAGGGITIFGNSSARIENNLISDNSSNFGGGIVVVYNAQATIKNNIIENNRALSQSDSIINEPVCGGIVVAYHSSATIENNTIRNNTSPFHSAGIFSIISSEITVRGNTISANNGDMICGGIFLGDYSNGLIEFNRISSHSSNQLSSGIFIGDFSTAEINSNTIEENNSDICGGIILSNNCSAEISNNTLNRNLAQSGGGGLMLLTKSRAAVRQNTFEENNGSIFGGGISVDFTSNLELDDPDSNSYSGNKPRDIERE